MDLAFTLAEAGIPLMLYPMPILGATAPVTPAGAAVVNNTEILGAITAIQLALPGARLIHAGGPTALYMRTGAYFANVPEALLLRAVQAPDGATSTACRPAWAGAAPRARSRARRPPTRTPSA